VLTAHLKAEVQLRRTKRDLTALNEATYRRRRALNGLHGGGALYGVSNMKKLFIAVTAASALGLAAPAAAQNYQPNLNARGAIGFDARIDNLQTRLQAGVQNGTITRAEAQRLRPQLRQLRDLERQYSMNGLTMQEQRDLQQRIRSLRQQIRIADNNAYDRYEQRNMWSEYDVNGQQGYGQQGYGQQGQQGYGQQGYGQQGQQGYGQQGYGQQGYGQQGYRGVGGGYEEVSQICANGNSSRGGILGSLLGGLLGSGGSSNNCLRVGQRVNTNLGYLPAQYQNQFRDGDGYVYRWADGNVLQIDVRTGVVARIWNVN
jgi:hypothetical protein